MNDSNNQKIVEDGAIEFGPSDVNYDPIRPQTAPVPTETPEQIKMIDDLTRYLNELKSNYTGSTQDLVQLVTGKIKELEPRDLEREKWLEEAMTEMIKQSKEMTQAMNSAFLGLDMNSLYFQKPVKKEEKGYFTRIKDRIKTYFK